MKDLTFLFFQGYHHISFYGQRSTDSCFGKNIPFNLGHKSSICVVCFSDA